MGFSISAHAAHLYSQLMSLVCRVLSSMCVYVTETDFGGFGGAHIFLTFFQLSQRQPDIRPLVPVCSAEQKKKEKRKVIFWYNDGNRHLDDILLDE